MRKHILNVSRRFTSKYLHLYIALSTLLVVPSEVQAKELGVSELGNSSYERTNLISQRNGSRPNQRLNEAQDLLDRGYQSYAEMNFEESEGYLKDALKVLEEDYGNQPNLDLPDPGGPRETRFGIPGFIYYYSSYTKPSEVRTLEAATEVPFDLLFSNITSRISTDPTQFQLSDLANNLLNQFGGCLYFSFGRSCSNYSSRGNLEQLFRDNPEFRDILEGFPGFGGSDTQNSSYLLDESGTSGSSVQAVLKDVLNLLQKSLVAQGNEEKDKEALLFAEMSKNVEFVRLAPIALYGLLNYSTIAGNPEYSRIFNTVPSYDVDIDDMQRIAKRDDSTIVYYSTASLYSEEELLIWVIQPSGDINLKKVDLSESEMPLNELVREALTAASSFIDRGQQETALIQAVRGLRSQNAGRPIISIDDFVIDESVQVRRLQSLHDTLVKPIEEFLPTNPDKHVVFIPHKSLTVVPFAALQDSEERYLIEKHTIRVAHSLSNLRKPVAPIREMPTGSEFLAIGNPDMPELRYGDGTVVTLPSLSSADREVVDISPPDGYWYRRDAASPERISPFIEEAKIVHFATHGILNFTNRREFMLVQQIGGDGNQSLRIDQNSQNIKNYPDFIYKLWYEQAGSDLSWQVVRAKVNLPGAIALADTFLTAENILSLQLNADLVVLSACNTGRGIPTEGGVLGLPFALGLAGAPRVVVSQWSVPDTATRLLMIEFYNAMRSNINSDGTADPAKALRTAMLKTKQFSSYSDPIHWAGFSMMNVSY